MFLLLFLLLVVVWVGVQVNRRSQSAQSASQERPPQLHKQTTGNVAFTISAGGTSNYKFTVPAMASNVTMKGHFAATGGFGNDIEVFVGAEDGFVNWQNGHGTKTFYNSGHVTQNSVNISLPSDPAKYYVVFSNKAALLTPRAVEASIDLNYYTPAGWSRRCRSTLDTDGLGVSNMKWISSAFALVGLALNVCGVFLVSFRGFMGAKVNLFDCRGIESLVTLTAVPVKTTIYF